MTEPDAVPDLPWTVAAFAARTGVPATTLRYWDDEGLLPAHRLDNGHRRYGPDDLPRLEMVRMCQGLGCTMDEVRLVLDAPDPAARARFAAEKLPEVLGRIELLRVAADVLRHVAVCEHTDAASCGAWMRSVLEPPGEGPGLRAG
ncbi:MerR family transcriptional regulator [Kineosporia sp. R_H_3]|uniref:helix-turn-helix domain-containing protein n=1 Tax=Kineosporia sp. R_H_3 TaxID=1961848 RepID=UPI0013041372|nr:MerR family transcriptional regulator [Kineosporia sp. R_H_3]